MSNHFSSPLSSALRRVPGGSVSVGVQGIPVPIPGVSNHADQVQVIRESATRTRIELRCACGKTTTLVCEAE